METLEAARISIINFLAENDSATWIDIEQIFEESGYNYKGSFVLCSAVTAT